MRRWSLPPAGLFRHVLVRIFGVACMCLVAACGEPGGAGEPAPVWVPGERPPPQTVSVDDMVFETLPPPWQGDDEIDADEIFPCSECHEPDDYNPERRELEMAHSSIVLRHDEEHRWCLDCHDAQNRDRLRLANGTLVPFEESYRLCGQCHGDKYRDWRAGVHGRRTGFWDDDKGEKQYLLCVHCHYSHEPAFKPRTPKPPPANPRAIR